MKSRCAPSSGFEVLRGRLEGTVKRLAYSLAGRPETALSDDLQQEMWIAILETGPGQTDSFYLSKAIKAAKEYRRQAPKRVKQGAGPTQEQWRTERALRHYDLDVVENLDWTPCGSKAVRRPFTTDEIADYRPYDPTWVRSPSFGIVCHHWTTLGAVRSPQDETCCLSVTRRPSYRIVVPRLRGEERGGRLDLAATLKAMSPDERALARALMAGDTAPEISEMLGVSERTVRRRIDALREHLRYDSDS